MFCKKCNIDKSIKSQGRLFTTLECNHTFSSSSLEVSLEGASEPLVNEIVSFAAPEFPHELNQPTDHVTTSLSVIPVIPVITNEISGAAQKEIVKREPRITSSDGRSPYQFQDDGIDFIANSGFRSLIADEMGLGKTIQALGTLKLHPKETLPCLILVKSPLKLQWFAELVRWCGLKGYLPQMIADGKSELAEGFNVYIASYDILRKFSETKTTIETTKYGMEREVETKTSPFYDFGFKTVILDEAQSIKNMASTRYEEVENICKTVPNVIALSGTPFKNSILEYFPVLNLLRPDLFPSIEHFRENFVKFGWKDGLWKPLGLKDPKFFKEYTSKFVLRRIRDEVDVEFPALNRVFYHVDFENEKARREYEKEQYKMIEELESRASSKNPTEILGIMAVCRHLVGLTKVKPTSELIETFLLDTDRKAVVFTHHKDVNDTMFLLNQNFCLDNDLPMPLNFHSGLTDVERNEVIQRFRDGTSRIMFASTLAAGGLNLQFCSDCFMVERQWNPANEEQAEGRFIRIGSTANKVNATYIIVSNTMDEWFTELVEAKRAIFKAALDGIESMDTEGSLLGELMKILLSKGRRKIRRGF